MEPVPSSAGCCASILREFPMLRERRRRRLEASGLPFEELPLLTMPESRAAHYCGNAGESAANNFSRQLLR
jgi:hypothetical protein